MTRLLSPANHDRDAAGLTYVYPVVSRRAGGVSIGINLNPNNACNWRCLYCQVPDLKRGGPPPIDLAQLEAELRGMLHHILHGDFMAAQVPEGMRRLNDIALSGNGEPTSAPEFPAVIRIIACLLEEFGLKGVIKLVLITNGSLVHRPEVQSGIAALAELNGEVWFKLDRATAAGQKQVNDTETDPERHYQRLKTVAALAPTWVQTCMFALDGAEPSPEEVNAYLGLLARSRSERVPLAGVLLYGLARPSLQPEAGRLSPVSQDSWQALAQAIRALGLPLRDYPA